MDVYKFSMWQQSNLVATKEQTASFSWRSIVDANTTNPPSCPPNADFLPVHQNVCPGSSIKFGPNTTNGTATSWNWSFPGGTPSASTAPNPSVVYSTAGSYSVTLTTGNGSGSSTITRNQYCNCDYGTGQNTVPFFDNFEDSQSFSGD